MKVEVESAVMQTLHYADIFDYAVTQAELVRYLIGLPASDSEIEAALERLIRFHACAVSPEGFLTLPGREMLGAQRLCLHEQALPQKHRARIYAFLLGYFPFVRMVGLTGALAMENARDDDIDFLIVSAPGHLWTVRAAAIALVRLARLAGDHLCPNFLIAENRLEVHDKNLYNAHEIVQMIPLYGFHIYRRFREVNEWAWQVLPNANEGRSRSDGRGIRAGFWAKALGERILSTVVGRTIERWEMSRKIKKLYAAIPQGADDVEFSAEVCRGFTSGHGRRALAEFETRAKQCEPVRMPRLEIENALEPMYIFANT